MKKKICLLLCFWLPLFFSAASYASASMQVAEVLVQATASKAMPASISNAESAMPDDCPMNMANHDKQKDKTSHNKCQQCGFCVSVSFCTIAVISDFSVPRPPFSSHIAWTSSPYLSPTDQRPPITL